jgi:hypothetical protein
MCSEDLKILVAAMNELKKQAPRNWAQIISKRMGKSPSMIREYSRGINGTSTEGPFLVLKHMKELVEERKQMIKNLTV